MKTVPNSTVSTLLRCLPLILANLDGDAMKGNLRLYNAVRQTRIIMNKLKAMNNSHKL